MKAWELIKALEEGKTIFMEHYGDPECVESMTLETYNNPEEIVKKLEVYGWGSAIGEPIDRVKFMLRDQSFADKWKIKE